MKRFYPNLEGKADAEVVQAIKVAFDYIHQLNAPQPAAATTRVVSVPSSTIALLTNGIPNGSQSRLNLVGPVSEDRLGNVTITQTEGLPLPQDKRFTLWQPIADCGSDTSLFFDFLCDKPNVAIVNGGTTTGVRPSATAATTFKVTFLQNQGIRLEGRSVIATARKASFETIVNAVQGTGQATIWVGLYGGVPWGQPIFDQDTCVGKGNLISFRYKANESANWQCCVGTSAAMTKQVSGVDFTTTPQKLKIEIDGTSAFFYINGALVSTISTNYPANTGLGLHIGYWLYGPGANGNGIAVQYVYGESVMP